MKLCPGEVIATEDFDASAGDSSVVALALELVGEQLGDARQSSDGRDERGLTGMVLPLVLAQRRDLLADEFDVVVHAAESTTLARLARGVLA